MMDDGFTHRAPDAAAENLTTELSQQAKPAGHMKKNNQKNNNIMTHEQFITPETAKLAKKAGFDWEIEYYYRSDKQLIRDHDGNVENWNDEIYSVDGCVSSAPTQSELQRWLREVKNIIVLVNYNEDDDCEENKSYGVAIYTKDGHIVELATYPTYPTYEAALEAAEQKILTLLIEIQNEKSND